MGWDLVVLLVGPFLVAAVCWFAPAGAGRALTLASGAGTFVLALLLVPTTGPTEALSGWLRVDALSIVFVVTVAFVYLATAVFSLGYLRPRGGAGDVLRYSRRFYAGLNVFAWSMIMAPLVDSLALLWVAIEVTTVVSALLVAIDGTDEASEAAWKYVLIASMGLGVALLATVVVYFAGTAVFGDAYRLFDSKLLGAAGRLPGDPVRLAFVLAVVGFGTKMGLVPVHTWLPDAHSEAPTPVSALLSASLLAVSFYAILRYYQLAVRAVGAAFPRDVLLAFGLASLGLAALYLASQRDLKRLLAYSSVEHMGILAIGMSFSAPIAVVGVLLHVLAHAAAKSTAFFGAGSVIRRFGTKDLRRMRGGIGVLPWTGPMLVLAILGLSAMPPSGIFRSEFLIVSGGLSDPRDAVAAVLVVLVTLASLGLSWFGTQTMMTPTDASAVRGETSRWMVASMLIGLVALALLGVHPPAPLSHLLTRAAHDLGASG
ncbi:MAG: proton-conducting transporter membrane subunit [Acidimicrobiales bacterium]